MAERIRYWGYRIAKERIPFFRKELWQERLRQGWGYHRGQDLREPTVDEGARRNLRMFREVKKGHILLIPRLPEWGQVAIVEATEDWDTGYQFDIHEDLGDFGHIFPAKFVKSFSREARGVSGDLRSSLRNLGRFWSLDWLASEIEMLRKADEQSLHAITDETRLGDAVRESFRDAFDEDKFGERIYETLNQQFDAARWEKVLVRVFQSQFPACNVTSVAGKTEKHHGTDIRISLPAVDREAPEHMIAVQVKDYKGVVGNDPVDQIEKASWWNEQGGYSLIEKVVVMTNALREQNPSLVEYAQQKRVRLVFADGLKKLLVDYAKRTMGLRSEG